MLEIVLALAILVGSLAAIGQIVDVGSRAATRSQFQSEATLRAQTVMSELLAGIQPLQTTSAAPFSDGAEGWTWSAAISDGPADDLLLVTVSVQHVGTSGRTNVETALSRLVRDPQLFIDAAAEASIEEAP